MEEEEKKAEGTTNKDEPQGEVMAKLEITLYRNGYSKLSGPLVNKALCKGMLSMAAQIIDDWKPTSEVL